MATNANKAVCDELLNNSHSRDINSLIKGERPFGKWRVVSNHIANDGKRVIYVGRAANIGQYAVQTEVFIYNYATITTYVSFKEEDGSTEYRRDEEYRFKSKDEDKVIHFAETIVREWEGE